MNKAVVFLGNGCEEIETLTIIDILRRGGVEVSGVSIMDSLEITGGHGIRFMADAMFDDIDFDSVKMVVCPGGLGGTNNIKAHSGVKNVIQDFIKSNDKHVAAICAAPSALGAFGVLKGRKAVCYPGFENQLAGAEVADDIVVTDGNLTTSKGPATAMAFALELLKIMTDSNTEKKVREGLLYL